MSGWESKTVADALNRIADALFQQAKALRENTKIQARQAESAAQIVEMQKGQLSVTKRLEEALEMQVLAEAEAALEASKMTS